MKDSEAFEDAVREAVISAKKDRKMFVVVVGGHDEYCANVELFHNVTATGNYMASQLDENRSNVKEVLSYYANINVTADEEERIKTAPAK